MHTTDTSCSGTLQTWFSQHPNSGAGVTCDDPVFIDCPVCDDDHPLEISSVAGQIIVTAAR
jgi:hypothetical protein